MLLINPRKFSLLFTLGSVFTLSSFSFLWGPYSHMVHLFSKERLPFTLVYLTTLIGIKDPTIFLHTHYFPIATLYFAMGLQSAILTPIAAVLQVFDNTHMHWVNKHFISRLLLFCGLLSATSRAARLASSSLQNSSQVSVDPRSIETFQFNDNHVI